MNVEKWQNFENKVMIFFDFHGIGIFGRANIYELLNEHCAPQSAIWITRHIYTVKI